MHIRREYHGGADEHVIDTDAIVQWVEYSEGECSINARPHVAGRDGYTGRIDITLTHRELLMIANAYNKRVEKYNVLRLPAALAAPILRVSLFARIRARLFG